LERDTIFSEYIPEIYIKNRSTVLGGLIDGLSVRGKNNVSYCLEEGSGLSRTLCHVPLEAIAKILFARPHLVFDDVKDVLSPSKNEHDLSILSTMIHINVCACFAGYVFDESETWEGTAEELEKYRMKQKEFYDNTFLPYLENKAKSDTEFLSRFVQCCTGSSCIPYVIPGTEQFLINVEFNLSFHNG
jgi:hypothetical protein